MRNILFKAVFVVLFTFSFISAQSSSINFTQLSNEIDENFESLHSSLVKSGYTINETPDLSDFYNRAQMGLDFMKPGSHIKNLTCNLVSKWNASIENPLKNYLLNLYKNDLENFGNNWIEPLFAKWKSKGAKIGLLSWEYNGNINSHSVESIVVFDEQWNVLFDTELINFIKNISTIEEIDNNLNITSPSVSNPTFLNNQQSGSRQINKLIEGVLPGSHVTMHWRVEGTAIISPYITSATNDAYFHFFTSSIHNWRSDASSFPLPPPGDPCIWFGLNGSYANLYQNSVPWQSSIYLTGEYDTFNSGIYEVNIDNGRLWSPGFSFSASLSGGFNISPTQNATELSLEALSENYVILNNYTFWHVTTNSYRAFFWDGGKLELNNFYILTGTGGNEIEKVIIDLPFNNGYTTAGTLWFLNDASILTLEVEYLRGNAIPHPLFEMTSSNFNIQSGQLDTIITTITNRSEHVNLEGGNVSLDPSSLNNQLVLMSQATLPIGIIEENSSKEFSFIVQGNIAGVVTPQAAITSLGWEEPVPELRIISDLVSIDSNITVSNVTGVGDINKENEIFDYTLYDNYPNPFNPATKIKYSIPNSTHVILKIYDMLGKELITLVNEEKQVGTYEVTWHPNNLTSGVCFYSLKAGGFMETKKMLILK